MLGGSATVLVVEDEQALLGFTRESLEELGYTVLAADSPWKAIRLVRNHTEHIDLLITDVVMPEMHGRDLPCACTPWNRACNAFLYMTSKIRPACSTFRPTE